MWLLVCAGVFALCVGAARADAADRAPDLSLAPPRDDVDVELAQAATLAGMR
jgi:hypothetical protein